MQDNFILCCLPPIPSLNVAVVCINFPLVDTQHLWGDNSLLKEIELLSIDLLGFVQTCAQVHASFIAQPAILVAQICQHTPVFALKQGVNNLRFLIASDCFNLNTSG